MPRREEAGGDPSEDSSAGVKSPAGVALAPALATGPRDNGGPIFTGSPNCSKSIEADSRVRGPACSTRPLPEVELSNT